MHDPAGALIDTCRYFDAGDYRTREITLCPHSEIHGGAREYRAYRDLMRKQGAVKFMTEVSARFEGSAQLVRLGLMRTEEALEQSVRMTQAARAQQRVVGAGLR